MKKSNIVFSFIIALAVALSSCGEKAKDTTKTTAQNVADTTKKDAFFGEKITEKDAIAVAELPKMLEKIDSTNTKIKAKIIQTCKMKGCWMDVESANGEKMNVTFDYEFFVPKEGMEGKEVIMQGMAKKTITDVARLKHLAQDAKKSKAEIDAITKPKEGITFVATGVIIKS